MLGFAAVASADGGQDPVDAAIRAAASSKGAKLPKLIKFIPLIPQRKCPRLPPRSKRRRHYKIVKGAYAAVIGLAPPVPELSAVASDLEAKGFRLLAVATGTAAAMRLAGLIALSDPPRD